MLRAARITKSFGGNVVLKDVTLSFASGRIHALLGENGAGKSTLVKILAGIHAPDSGTVELEGRPVVWKSPAQAQEAGITMIPQELNLAAHLTVARNVFLGAEPTRWRIIDDAMCLMRTTELIGDYGLDFRSGDRVSALTPSQRQQVEILRALVRAQRVLILDEPTAYFSERESRALFEIMRRLRDQGLSLIFISHRLEELEGLADDVTVLRDGVCVKSGELATTGLHEILSLMLGSEMGQVFPGKATAPGPPLLELRDVGLPGSLYGISFEIHRGEIFGLGGFVGSGRTAAAEVLFGLHPAYSGEIRLDGQPIRIVSPSQALELGVGFVTEDRQATGVFPGLSVAANISLLSLSEFQRHVWLSAPAEKAACQSWVSRLRVRSQGLDQPIARLSGGNQQKCILARWLMTRPRILILDEPTRGVDVGARVDLYRWFRALADEGLGLLLISSDLRELEGLCDRVAVFREGRLAAVLAGDRVKREMILRHAALGP